MNYPITRPHVPRTPIKHADIDIAPDMRNDTPIADVADDMTNREDEYPNIMRRMIDQGYGSDTLCDVKRYYKAMQKEKIGSQERDRAEMYLIGHLENFLNDVFDAAQEVAEKEYGVKA